MKGKTKYILALCEVIALLFGLIPNNVEAAKTDIPIPIVMATDNNYAMPTMVSITSAAENANKDTKLEFYILITPDFSKDNASKLEKVAECFSNCSIKIINMGDTFRDVYKSRWGTAMYYRLKVTSILKDKDKCIYLDGDTLVLKDLTDMYNTDIGDNYVAGISDGICTDRYAAGRLGIPDADHYICSGVLLWNLKKAREDNLEQKFDKFLEEVIGKGPNENIIFPDQDALNVVCYGKITNLRFKYGALDWVLSHSSYEENVPLKKMLSKEEWEEATKDPVILHFVEKKPWKFRNVRFRPLWKKYQMHMSALLK